MDIKPILNIVPSEIKTYVDDIDINYTTPKDVIIGTFIGRLLELKVSKLDIVLPEEISIELGININNMKKQPTFKTKSYELDPDTGEYTIKGMDYSYKFDVQFDLEIPDEITNLELAQIICNYLGIEIENIDFANAGFQMTAKKVDNKFICRDIIAMIAADMGGIAFINSNNKLEFKKITTKSIIIENVFNTEIKNDKIGPINSIVLAREPQQDYINLKDDTNISTYGKTEVKITNNVLVDDNREGAIQAIYDNLYGIEFYCAMIESYQGFEVDPFDLVTISGRQILINNINIKYPMMLDGKIGIEQLSKMEIQQNIAKGLEKRVINAELKVDKITGQITSIVSEQTVQGDKLTEIEQTVDGITSTVESHTTSIGAIESDLSAVQDDVSNFIDVTYETDKNSLQAQIDGQIMTYFEDYEPTLSNLPASTWATFDDKAKHMGDLFYDSVTGLGYRFSYENSVWQWIELKDTDVGRALANAQRAQDTADGKRRVFTTTPTVPYDIRRLMDPRY